MKLKLKHIALALIGITTLGSCKKELEDRYNNPEASSQALIPSFFTSVLNNNRIRPSYWEMRTFVLSQVGIYSQTTSYGMGNTIYQQNNSYVGQRWRDFYAVTYDTDNRQGNGINALYKQMEKTYAELPDAEKVNNEVFLNAAQIVRLDQASQMVDMWGDIPFSETGSLVTDSKLSNGKFDDQRELYTYFIATLKTLGDYFRTATIPAVASATFGKQDIMLKGSANLWARYAYSLRLRLLMRIAEVDATTARTQILEMLANPTQYPLVDGAGVAQYTPASVDILLQPLTVRKNTQLSALTEGTNHFASDFLLNKTLLPVNDPRIPILFDKYGTNAGTASFVPNADYKAMPITFTAEEQSQNYQRYSIMDSTTFLNNQELPGILMTASEVNFIKAEAFERWGGGNARDSYELAIRQSIAFYYYLNRLNQLPHQSVPLPTTAEVDAFLARTGVSYTGTQQERLAKLYTQKWVHFGYLQSIQAWAEYRRTNYPQLTFVNSTLSGFQTPPSRLLYPTIETQYNTSYEAVKAKDTRDAKIFWDVN